MIPREVIKRNLEFSNPSRIGLVFDRKRISDFRGAGIDNSEIFKQNRWVEGNKEYYNDIWGNVWYRVVGMSSGGEIFKPVIEDWSALKILKLPDLGAAQRFEKAHHIFDEEKQKYRVGNLPGFPFAICRYMRKLEIYLQDIILERAYIDELHDKVTTLLEKVIKNYADVGADGVFFCEDWGTQERLLISPDMWREIYKPLYKRLCDVAHKNGLNVLMHSCGYNWMILDDLAEVGINAFQFDQPELYGLEKLAQKLQKLKVCLYSPVDIQRTMQSGNKELITQCANEMVKLFFGPHGGLIAKNYGDLNGIGVLLEWDNWAYETFLDHCQGLI